MTQKQQEYHGGRVTYPVGLVPGPTSVPANVLAAFTVDYGSADLEAPFFELYARVQTRLARLLRVATAPSSSSLVSSSSPSPSSSSASSSSSSSSPSSAPASPAAEDSLQYADSVILQVGEGMLALWSALKSTVRAGDRVLAVSNGVYGSGFAEMAQQIGADVRVVEFENDRPIHDFERIRKAAHEFKPHLITAVQCETPSGMMNKIEPLGRVAREVDALLYVDFVSAAFGEEVYVDKWNIDLGLLGSQKVISSTPSLSIVTVSERAWRKIEDVKYCGYDALLPWKGSVAKRYFPYTFDWHSLAALSKALEAIEIEGLEQQIKRHRNVAFYCRQRLRSMGLKLSVKGHEADQVEADGAIEEGMGYASTVTAAYVPLREYGGHFDSWEEFDAALRARGLVVGGSYGDLAGKVFRVGHMGSQANKDLVCRGLDIIEAVLATKAAAASTISSSS